MFLDNLSANLLHICETRKLSYEAASEQCHISSRYFGSIVRGQTAPTVLTLEKVCMGLDLTPNDLLISTDIMKEMDFQEPMNVTQIRCFQESCPCGHTSFPVCPRCNTALEREYQVNCDHCGQRLNWKSFSKATVILCSGKD